MSTEKALSGKKTVEADVTTRKAPDVRVSMRLKIIFPYAVMALLFAIATTYLISQYVFESIQDRFANQLKDSAMLSADWMVGEETRLLRTLRYIANVEGLAEAVNASDAERLRELIVPLAVNYQEEEVEILDVNGASLLSLHRPPGGSPVDLSASKGSRFFSTRGFVLDVLQQQVDEQGDKYASLVQQSDGTTYFYIAGPVYDTDNRLIGAVLVGRSLETMASENRQSTLAQITFYDLNGAHLATTLLVPDQVQDLSPDSVDVTLERQDDGNVVRDFQLNGNAEDYSTRDIAVASSTYTEILVPWEARGGEDLGVVGISLAQNFQFLPSLLTRFQAMLIIALAFVCVVVVGAVIARQVTRPLSQVVRASTEVAAGNLEVKVPSGGDDEMAVLAYAFNYMVSGLQEGSIYRDLLGRTVSPEVREALRQSFDSGLLRLEGQNSTATVLITDIRGFTGLSEKEEPATILNWLNEYFAELVPAVTSYGGVVDKFEGDAMLSFFGILPKPLPPEDSACAACQAALEILRVLEELNMRRMLRGEPQLLTGIGVNTGVLTAGGLGTSDRVEYTIIGDTVNSTQRMQVVTREFGESGIVISEHVLNALKGYKTLFTIEPLGEHSFPGKKELLWLAWLKPLPASGQREGSNAW